jgi:tetratricopeptide (TPR) repeat protein
MAIDFQNPIRRVVPRWHSFKDAIARQELDPTQKTKEHLFEAGDFLTEKENRWKETRELAFALDFVNAANVLGVTESAKTAAQFVLDRRKEISSLAIEIASSVSGIERPENNQELQSTTGHPEIAGGIRKIRVRTISEPRNAFVWAELARLYILLGLPIKAERPMQIALGLAPQDRFILRSASRFFLHTSKPDAALDLLRKSGVTRLDPWLLAAELAISSVVGKSPRFWREALGAVSSTDFSPFHLSELATAIGSIEMWNGRDRRAKEIFRSALESPTENALAQIVWASRDVGLIGYPLPQLKTLRAFEAEALDARNRGDWNLAFQRCHKWANDESFSSRPYGLGSAIASSILRAPQQAIDFATKGLVTNPFHPGLINNIAFALVESGKPKEAQVVLSKADLEKADTNAKACILATGGLILYRLGNPEEGRRLYETTINFASKHGIPLLKATAQLYLAREEIYKGHNEFEKVFTAGNDYIQKNGDAYAKAVATEIKREIAQKLESKKNLPFL